MPDSSTTRQGEVAKAAPWSLRSTPTFALGVAATAGAIVGTIGMRPDRPRTARANSILRTWARAWVRPAGVQFEVAGLQHLEPGQLYVVVSNHLSNLDPMVHLAALPVPLRFLAMRELFDVPLLGAALRRIGMIEVDRQDPDGSGIARGAARALKQGVNVLVYPEGETSHDGSLNRFRLGAFTIAIDHGIPVLPVMTHGTREIWAPGSNAIRKGVVRLSIQPPILTHELSRSDAIALRDSAYAAIAAASGKPL